MRKVNIRWRWFRRLVNVWIEAAKYYPENKQRFGIVNKIMQEGEPKNWGPKDPSRFVANADPFRGCELPGDYLPFGCIRMRGESILNEIGKSIDFTQHPALQPDDGIGVPGEPFEHIFTGLGDSGMETYRRVHSAPYGIQHQHPFTIDECYSPLEHACNLLKMPKNYRKVYRSDTGVFMGYLVGVSLANQCTTMDAVEIEPVSPFFTHWHPLSHVKFDA